MLRGTLKSLQLIVPVVTVERRQQEQRTRPQEHTLSLLHL